MIEMQQRLAAFVVEFFVERGHPATQSFNNRLWRFAAVKCGGIGVTRVVIGLIPDVAADA
jgi:hypothetical protein